MAKLRWNPEEYRQVNQLQHESALLGLHRYCNLSQNDHVLDIGCGDGSLINKVVQQFELSYVQAVDRSTDMISHAKQNYDASDIRFAVADVTNLHEVKSQSVDWVLVCSILHWVGDLDKAFAEIERVLKPGGQCFIVHWPYNEAIYLPIKQLMGDPRWEGLSVALTAMPPSADRRCLQMLCQYQGLTVSVLEDRTWFPFNTSLDYFSRFLLALLPLHEWLPEDQHALFIEQVTDNALSIYARQGEGIAIPMRCIYAVAQKPNAVEAAQYEPAKETLHSERRTY
ncbi:class I SAM-dependent methyltransferase [Zooshikella harenae]|uniref:Class I SAM-dependent methyltransferase n=1 Tax=Zooshikella harenae TaxID=2827238 RepID=A0ABS5ZGE8_9GAMM|nr:class I SAM-dependent methyltransferase [Zooshikella harenae]MBU2713126.1 class I SAM-dependent methyltransferase [Zooshikella harenae]